MSGPRKISGNTITQPSTLHSVQRPDMTRPLGLTLALLLTANLTADLLPQLPDAEPITAEGVRNGVQFVADKIFALYPAPHRFHSEAEWQMRLCDVKQRADHIDQARLFIEVSRLLGML